MQAICLPKAGAEEKFKGKKTKDVIYYDVTE